MTTRSHRTVLAAGAALALGVWGPSALAADAPKTPVQLPPPPAGKGEVVFYRKPLFSLVPFNWIAREGKTEICEMEAGTYCIAIVDPGTHTYEVHSEAKNDLTIEVDEGETYYIIGGISMGLVVNHPNISPAQKIDFDALSYKLKSIPPMAAASGQAPAAPAPAATPTESAPPPAPAAPAPAAPTT